ncbi:MAG: response regulator transcription factor, partial [Granulicatella sp.]|nr:response regulator transcription factor [Granulicatella sp.]
YITKALAIGCKGYLLKQHIKGIIPAIEAVMNHQIVYDSTIDMPVKKLVQRKTSKLLNERENELLYLIAEGYNNKEIAEKMYLSEGTIRNYLSLLLEKLNVRDRTQLAIYYYKDLVE